jgi:hypothetical protein
MLYTCSMLAFKFGGVFFNFIMKYTTYLKNTLTMLDMSGKHD